MKKISLLLLLVCVNLMVCARTMNEADAQIVEKIKQGNLSCQTITCDFKQIQHLSIMDEEMVSKGKLYYRKPEKLAMHYTDPEGEMMAIDGNKFVMVMMGSRKEVDGKTNPKMQGMKTILSACMKGDISEMGALKVTCKETAKYYVVTAVIDQQTNQSGISEVVVSYDKTNFSVASIKTIEEEDYTIYELTNKKLNQPVADRVFQN